MMVMFRYLYFISHIKSGKRSHGTFGMLLPLSIGFSMNPEGLHRVQKCGAKKELSVDREITLHDCPSPTLMCKCSKPEI